MRLKVKLLSMAIIFLLGCSPRVVGIYNEGVGKNAKTFMILLPDKKTELTEENIRLDEQLQEIIKNSLGDKGLEPSRLPDLYLSYMINVHTASDTQHDNYNFNRFNYYNYYYNYH